jgi:drug/metabolite transporter (DMT)-like permease
MSWFWYAIAAPFIYSFSNFIDKFLVEKKVKNPMVLTVTAGFLSCFIGILIGILGGFKTIPVFHLALILAAGILMEFYIWPYYLALKTDDASNVVPLYQFVPVFVLMMSAILLKEIISIRQLFGFVSILFGGFMIATDTINGKLLKPRKSLWFMMLSSFLYGSVLILFRFVTISYGFWTTLTYEFIGMGLGAVLLLGIGSIRNVFVKQVMEMRSVAGLILINDGICILAQMSEAFALTLVSAPLVSIVGGTQPLIVLFVGYILSRWFPHIIREDIRKSVVGFKLFMIVFIFIGVYLINT